LIKTGFVEVDLVELLIIFADIYILKCLYNDDGPGKGRHQS